MGSSCVAPSLGRSWPSTQWGGGAAWPGRPPSPSRRTGRGRSAWPRGEPVLECTYRCLYLEAQSPQRTRVGHEEANCRWIQHGPADCQRVQSWTRLSCKNMCAANIATPLRSSRRENGRGRWSPELARMRHQGKTGAHCCVCSCHCLVVCLCVGCFLLLGVLC